MSSREKANEDVLLSIFSIFDNFSPRKKDWIMNQFSAQENGTSGN